MPVITAIGNPQQEDYKLEASVVYIARICQERREETGRDKKRGERV